MTEAEWLACNDPKPLLEFLRGKGTDRKLRLFACACCRRAWDSMPDPRSRKAVETAENYADGRATDQELNTVSHDALSAAQVKATEAELLADNWRTRLNASFAPWAAVEATVRNGRDGIGNGMTVILIAKDTARGIGPVEIEVQARLVRDIFGNPFRPGTIDSVWQTHEVVALAEAIYDQRAFDRLPSLVDALEEAGCTNTYILDHCRQPGPHVRGCWVVDLILGKK
jgi:hypothetical protein